MQDLILTLKSSKHFGFAIEIDEDGSIIQLTASLPRGTVALTAKQTSGLFAELANSLAKIEERAERDRMYPFLRDQEKYIKPRR